MSVVTPELRALIDSGPLAHVVTIEPDGSPQVTVVWIALDGDDVVSAHMGRYRKLRNIERDPRISISIQAPSQPGVFMTDYAVLYGTGPQNVHTSVHVAIVTQVWPDGAIDTVEGDAGPGPMGGFNVIINGPFLPSDSLTFNGFGIFAYAVP